MSRMNSVLLALLLLGVPARASEVMHVAVTDLDATNADPRVAAVLTEAIAAELRKYTGLSVLGLSDVRAVLDNERTRQLLGCEGGSECMAEVGGALGVDAIVVGQLAMVGDARLLNLRRVRSKDAVVERGFTRAVPPADGQELLSVVGEAVATLFPDRTLRPDQVAGVAVEFVTLLRPPPLPKVVVQGVAAGTVLALLGAAGFAIASQVTGAELARIDAEGHDKTLLSGQEYSGPYATSRFQVNVATIFVVVAGALAGTGAIAMPFTDWDDYAGWKPGRPAPVR